MGKKIFANSCLKLFVYEIILTFDIIISTLGDWDATEGVYLEDTEEDVADKLEKKLVDEDADVDESDCIEDWDTEALAVSMNHGFVLFTLNIQTSRTLVKSA